jgi:hypothetical protein
VQQPVTSCLEARPWGQRFTRNGPVYQALTNPGVEVHSVKENIDGTTPLVDRRSAFSLHS